MTLETMLEIVRLALGGSLVLANIAVWYGVWLERDTAPLEVQQRGWRILVRGLAAETALGLLLFASDTSLGIMQSERIAIANARADQAALQAARLGVAVDGLPGFVNSRIAAVRAQYADLRTAIDADVARNNAAIADLKRSTADLEKARRDALTAADTAKKDLADMNAALAQERELRDRFAKLTEPRVIDEAKGRAIAQSLRAFAGQQWTVTPFWSVKESLALANRLKTILDSANWKYDDDGSKGTLVGGIQGIFVGVDPLASPKTKAAAAALVAALKGAGLEAATQDSGTEIHDRLYLTVGTKN